MGDFLNLVQNTSNCVKNNENKSKELANIFQETALNNDEISLKYQEKEEMAKLHNKSLEHSTQNLFSEDLIIKNSFRNSGYNHPSIQGEKNPNKGSVTKPKCSNSDRKVSTNCQKEENIFNSQNICDKDLTNCFESSIKLSSLDFINKIKNAVPNDQIVCDETSTNKKQVKNRKGPLSGQLKEYLCNVCDMKFKYGNSLKRHMYTHTGEVPFTCETCGKHVYNRYDYRVHIQMHAGYKPFKCTVCDRAFTRKSNLKVHFRTHDEKKHFICPVCNKGYNLKASLTAHYNIHSNEKQYKCEFCSKCFIRPSSYYSHKRVHTGEKPYSCDICDKKFTVIGNMHAHRLIHTNEGAFKCDVCNKIYTRKSTLYVHKKNLHSEVKDDIVCHICNKKFSSKRNLFFHMSSHNKKMFPCDFCHKKFTYERYLQEHQKIHTEDNPYFCLVCNKRFTSASSVRSHRRRLHLDKPLDDEIVHTVTS